MKTVLAALMLTLLPVLAGAMGDGPHDSHPHNLTQSSEQTYSATGKVKSISEDRRSLRIFHDPIPALKWPAMNMKFDVSKDDLNDRLEVGDTVRFEFIQKEGKQIITKISK